MTVAETAQERIAFLRNLRAVRQFRLEPVPQEALQGIFEVARWSGSASNQQPWELVVVQDPATLKKLSSVEGYASHLAGAAAGIILVMAGDPTRNSHEAYDEGRLSERIMLAASAYGLGSCIGWFINDGPAEVKKILGIPAEKGIRTAISIGYADEEALKNRPKRAQARKPLNEIVHEEHY